MQNDTLTYLNFIRVLADAVFGHETCLSLTLNQTHKHQDVFPSSPRLTAVEKEEFYTNYIGEKKEQKQFTHKHLSFLWLVGKFFISVAVILQLLQSNCNSEIPIDWLCINSDQIYVKYYII